MIIIYNLHKFSLSEEYFPFFSTLCPLHYLTFFELMKYHIQSQFN